MKKIHIFGTSFSIGGGFDWGDPNKTPLLNKIYKHIAEPKTIRNFSWPGQLERLIKNDDIEIINHSKCGFGNELIYRKIFDITNSSDFKKEDNLFLIEFSYYGRKEFYSKEIGEWFIVNYNESDMNNLSFSHDYQDFSHSESYYKKIHHLNKLKRVSREFLDDTLYNNANSEILGDWGFVKNLSYLVSYLNYNDINFLYTSPPVVDTNRLGKEIKGWFKDKDSREENIRYSMEGGEQDVEGFVAFFNIPEHDKFKLHITGETNGIIQDMHLGLWGAKIVAQQTYNRLVTDGWIVGEKIEFPKKPIINLEVE